MVLSQVHMEVMGEEEELVPDRKEARVQRRAVQDTPTSRTKSTLMTGGHCTLVPGQGCSLGAGDWGG